MNLLNKIEFELVKEIAVSAGEEILKIYENFDADTQVQVKSDDSPLTIADQAAHNIIAKGLAKLPTQYPVLSEEGALIDYEERKEWDTFWLVDPLDGTKEFIKKNGEFTVNIALIHKGYPVLGVIYAPVLNDNYWAFEGKAFKQEAGKEPFEISVANKKELLEIKAVGSRSHASEEEEKMLENFKASEKVSKGSSLKFCLIAEGVADIYYRHNPTMEWDTGAGQAIVEGAGGEVLTVDKERFFYNKEVLRNNSFLCLGLNKKLYN